MKSLPAGLCGLISLTAFAFEPEDFARVWTLQPQTDAPAYRLQLHPEVHAAVAGNDLTDLIITDANDQPVPFAPLPREHLVEPLSERLPLTYEAVTIEETPDENGAARAPLKLELEHGDTRVVLTTPPDHSRTDTDRQWVFEALIASDEVSPELPDRTLVLRLKSEQPADLECRYRDADQPERRERAFRFASEGTSHPYRYTAIDEIENLPRAWHVRCFGQRVPAGLELDEAYLNAWGKREHAASHRLEPRLNRENGAWHFQLPGPYRVRTVVAGTAEPNQLTLIRLESRTEGERQWRPRGQGRLSTLPGPEAGPARIEVQPEPRDRQWRLQADPRLTTAPRVVVEIEAEERVFLAQGQGPWKLYAGSLKPPDPGMSQDLIGMMREQLGHPWSWPVVTPGNAREAGGAAALVPPRDPVPWQRYFLWGVLIVGALLIMWQSIRLLRKNE